MNLRHGMPQEQRDIVILQALIHIAGQTARPGQYLIDTPDMCPLQGQTARHNHADITRTKNDRLAPRHTVVQIDISLCCSRREYTARTLTRNSQCPPRTLTAAHRKNDRSCLPAMQSVRCCRSDDAIRRQLQYHRADTIWNTELLGLSYEVLRILRPAQTLSEACQPKTVMNTLTQNAAQCFFPFQEQDVPDARLVKRNGCCQTRRPAADDDNLFFLCHASSRTFPVNIQEPGRL